MAPGVSSLPQSMSDRFPSRQTAAAVVCRPAALRVRSPITRSAHRTASQTAALSRSTVSVGSRQCEVSEREKLTSDEMSIFGGCCAVPDYRTGHQTPPHKFNTFNILTVVLLGWAGGGEPHHPALLGVRSGLQ